MGTSAIGERVEPGHGGRAPVSAAGRAAGRLGALGGIAAQLSQAMGSLLLQIVAARMLGATGLGAFAVLYGLVIMATAVSTGLVGDSLTVLDRGRREIRAALQTTLLVVVAAAAVVAYLVGWIGGFLSPAQSGLFAGATAVFLVEDVLRRLLMADLRFWRIVLVDLTALAGSLATLLLAAWLRSGGIDLGTVLLALLVGQATAIGVAVLLLPAAERWLARPAVGDARAVIGYGSWRAVQQFVRPALLTSVRLLVVAMAGLAAMGALEAARIYTAPLLLVVSGTSSFLFASYARTKAGGPAESAGLLRRADRGVLGLFAGTAAMSVVAVAGMGMLGPVLTSDDIVLSGPAVIGWCLYAVSVAAVTPYGALAAVRRHQVAVLVLRCTDSLLSLAAVWGALALGVQDQWIPTILAVGSLAGGIAIRQFLLVRPARR